MASSTNSPARRCGLTVVFWDYENCPCLQTEKASGLIRKIKDAIDDCVGFKTKKEIRLYCQTDNIQIWTRKSFLESGVTMIDVPTQRKQESVDKQIIADLALCASDLLERHHSAVICLISGDSDFAYVLSRLRGRRQIEKIVLITKSDRVRDTLLEQADHVVRMFDAYDNNSGIRENGKHVFGSAPEHTQSPGFGPRGHRLPSKSSMELYDHRKNRYRPTRVTSRSARVLPGAHEYGPPSRYGGARFDRSHSVERIQETDSKKHIVSQYGEGVMKALEEHSSTAPVGALELFFTPDHNGSRSRREKNDHRSDDMIDVRQIHGYGSVPTKHKKKPGLSNALKTRAFAKSAQKAPKMLTHEEIEKEMARKTGPPPPPAIPAISSNSQFESESNDPGHDDSSHRDEQTDPGAETGEAEEDDDDSSQFGQNKKAKSTSPLVPISLAFDREKSMKELSAQDQIDKFNSFDANEIFNAILPTNFESFFTDHSSGTAFDMESVGSSSSTASSSSHQKKSMVPVPSQPISLIKKGLLSSSGPSKKGPSTKKKPQTQWQPKQRSNSLTSSSSVKILKKKRHEKNGRSRPGSSVSAKKKGHHLSSFRRKRIIETRIQTVRKALSRVVSEKSTQSPLTSDVKRVIEEVFGDKVRSFLKKEENPEMTELEWIDESIKLAQRYGFVEEAIPGQLSKPFVLQSIQRYFHKKMGGNLSRDSEYVSLGAISQALSKKIEMATAPIHSRNLFNVCHQCHKFGMHREDVAKAAHCKEGHMDCFNEIRFKLRGDRKKK